MASFLKLGLLLGHGVAHLGIGQASTESSIVLPILPGNLSPGRYSLKDIYVSFMSMIGLHKSVEPALKIKVFEILFVTLLHPHIAQLL